MSENTSTAAATIPAEEALRQQLLEMILSGILSQAIGVAAELGIPDLLAEGPQSAAELAAAVQVQSDKLHRLLRYTASYGIFRDTGDGRFELTPLASLLRSDKSSSVRAAGRLVEHFSRAFPFLLDNLRTGKCAFDSAFGKPVFEYFPEHPQHAAIFDAAMSSFHGGETEAALNAYPLDGVKTLCDVGCGNGAVIAAALAMYPSMTGILFDLDHVIERTRAGLAATKVAARCRFETGSFFETAPSGADVYIVRHVIHDWQDAEAIRILRTIRSAMGSRARLLIMEAVVPEGNDPSFAKMADMAMMLWPNGLERTAGEFRALLDAAGFDLAGITPTASPVSVIEARPR